MNDYEISLGPWFKMQRTRKLLGLRETARNAGIGYVTLLRLESDTFIPRVSTVRKVAETLGLDLDEVKGRFDAFVAERQSADAFHRVD